MPRQPNALQQIVRAIQYQLAGGARVTEWLLLAGRDGTPREVDTLIELTTGPRPLRVALEYRDQPRPADVAWVEHLRGKYRDLPVDHVLAVARGFTPAARTIAAAHRIRVLTLAEARKADWARAFHTAFAEGADEVGSMFTVALRRAAPP